MHKHIHSVATYPLRVHQVTTQQVGKRGKRKEITLIKQNPTLIMHKHVHSMATYPLRVHQSQRSKWVKVVKERISTQHKIEN